MPRTIVSILFIIFALPAQAAPALQVRPLNEVAVFPERSAAAQVVSLNESRLSAEIAARIERIPAEPGQTVAKGDLLVQLDCRDHALARERAEAALQASEARAKVAELQLERSRKLAEQKFISPAGLDAQLAATETARAEAAVNRSTLKSARNDERKCAVRAPFPAVVLERIAQEGEMAAAGTPLLMLRDLSRIEVRAEVQEKGAPLTGTDEVALATPAGRYPLRLIRLSPALDKATRLLEARLRFTGAAAVSGSSGRIVWRSTVPHLPPQLVVRREGRLGVFVLEGDKPRFVPLPQAEEGRPAPASELPADARIVVKGHESL